VTDLTYSDVSNEHSSFYFRGYGWGSTSLEAEDIVSFERSKSVISATQRNMAEDQNPANVS